MKRFWHLVVQFIKSAWKVIHRFISIVAGFPLVAVVFLLCSLMAIICDKLTLKAYADMIEEA